MIIISFPKTKAKSLVEEIVVSRPTIKVRKSGDKLELLCPDESCARSVLGFVSILQANQKLDEVVDLEIIANGEKMLQVLDFRPISDYRRNQRRACATAASRPLGQSAEGLLSV